MTSLSPQSAAELRDIETMLRACHRRVCRSARMHALSRGMDWAASGVAAWALLYAVVRVAAAIGGSASPLGWIGFAVVAVIVVVASVAVSLADVYGRLPSFVSAAERLDLATRSHNRVATAIWLLEAGDGSAFARAAVVDGMDCLRRLKDQAPYLDPVRWRWRRDIALVFGIVLVLAVAGFVPVSLPATPDALPEAGEPADALAGRPIGQERGDKRLASTQPKPETSQAQLGTLRRAGQAGGSEATAEKRPGEMTTGRASGGGRAVVRRSRQVAGSRGDSSETASSSRSDEAKTGKGAQRKRPQEMGVVGQKRPPSAEESSSVSQGSAGGGAMLAVQNPWSQKARSAPGEQDEGDEEGDVEDQAESNSQRGGIQPSLKDRNEAPGRELGISEGQGPPGSGGGGPTPPKKSRGTASLVLGVPVPDFVKGRLAPGTTKVTHERVEPSLMPGEPTRAAEGRPRTLPENPDERFHVPSRFARFVRAYLIALHSSDRNAGVQVGLTSDQSKNPERGSLP